MAAKDGGYDYDFYDSLPDECPCLVCTLVQREPHQLTCCGKIFCKSCLDQLIRKKNRPNCRSDSIREEKYFPDMNTERKIRSLHVRCYNKKNGCRWIGLMRELDRKHIPVCRYEMVCCKNPKDPQRVSNNSCNKPVLRHLLKEHMNEKCQWRVVSCELCGEKDTFHYINGKHIRKCPDILLPCSNIQCGLKIKCHEMDEHLKTCPKEIVGCQYSSLGCQSRVRRKDTQSHTQEAMAAHLEMTADALKLTTSVLKKTMDDLKNTSNTLKQVLQRIDKLENSHKEEYFYT